LSSIGGGLSLRISKEKRAASIKVDKVSGVSGFVLPGDRVDIIASIVRPGSGQESIAKTVLQNVEVLAAGESTERKGDKVITVHTVTLLVDPEGVQVLALSSQMAKLHLALRNPADHDTLAVKSITKSSMLKEKKKPAPKVTYKPRKKKPSPPKKKEEPVNDSLVIIRGANKKTEIPVMSEEAQKEPTKP
jgi:pilus assembly protein CpaB